MSDKDRNHAAEQENSAANLANLDVDDAPVSELPDVADGDLDGKTADEGNSPQSDRLRREPQE
jgi:hypothetical protein